MTQFREEFSFLVRLKRQTTKRQEKLEKRKIGETRKRPQRVSRCVGGGHRSNGRMHDEKAERGFYGIERRGALRQMELKARNSRSISYQHAAILSL